MTEFKELCYQQHKHLSEARLLSLERDVLGSIKDKGNRDESDQMTVVFSRTYLELEDRVSYFAWPQTGCFGPWANYSVFLKLHFLYYKNGHGFPTSKGLLGG